MPIVEVSGVNIVVNYNLKFCPNKYTFHKYKMNFSSCLLYFSYLSLFVHRDNSV